MNGSETPGWDGIVERHAQRVFRVAFRIVGSVQDAEDVAQQAMVFVMIHFEHLSRGEVSASLGISPEAVSTALYKARQRLLAQMAVYNGESR